MASLTCLSPLASCATHRQQPFFQAGGRCASRSTRATLPSVVKRSSSYCNRSSQRTSQRVSCSADDFEEGELIKGVKAGDKLKVKGSRVVYHAPKHKDGLDLKDKEGTLVEVIEKLQGKSLSANLPYKTQFMIPKDDGKELKLIVHLAAGEFEKIGDA